MTQLEWQCLALIRCCGPINGHPLAARMGRTWTDIVPSMELLVDQGLVANAGHNVMDLTLKGRARFNREVRKRKASPKTGRGVDL